MKLSLRWKIFAWALVNLALIGGAVVWFLHVQFQIGIHSLLAGSTGERLDAIARQLAPELLKRAKSEWPAALEEAAGYWRTRGVKVALVHNSGSIVTGDFTTLPNEVTEALAAHNTKMGVPPGGKGGPRKGPGGPMSEKDGPPNRQGDRMEPPDGSNRDPGGPGRGKPPGDFPFPDDRFGPGPAPGANSSNTWEPRLPPLFPGKAAAITPTTTFEKFMRVSSGPRGYWAGVHLDSPAGPTPYTLVLTSHAIRGGGLFFDYMPWLVLGTGLALMSMLLWLPMVHTLTKTLRKLTGSAERIAAGSFTTPPPETRRGDELGRLQNAHRHMAQRLDGFVTGQKRFLGDTAHELLSPLARLEVALSILEQRAKDGERNTVDRALGEVRRIASLVHELLAFSKSSLAGQDTPPEPVDLEPLVRDILTEEGGALTVDAAIPADCRVQAIPNLLRRAIGNVIRNAARYAGNDGPVMISATPSGDSVSLTIRDSGPGVPDDALPKLFDPFFRPDTSRTTVTGGTGLGLAIVKSCVEACGGTVKAENLRPRGFAVEITLPAARD